MRRREVIAGLCGTAAAWPLAARAQQPSIPIVGYLFPGMPGQAGVERAFRNGLSEHGFVEGRNVIIEARFARNEQDRLPQLAADLVRRRVSVIASTGGPAPALAAKAATTTIPIVFETGSDPVQDGLVASFNRPGGNITGISAMNAELDGKRLELLTELVPRAVRIGVLISQLRQLAVTQTHIRKIDTAAAALGRQIELFYPTNSREIDEFFVGLAQRQIDALFVSASTIYYSLRVKIATAAAQHAIPTLGADREMANAGTLASYGSDVEDNWRLVGTYVARILKGEKPADLPVMQPTKFLFVINLQTARKLGVVIPTALLARADEVIE